MNRRGYALLIPALALFSSARPLAAGAAQGQAIVMITPCRAVDTRNAPGPLGGPAMAANTTRVFPIAGTCGVPANALGLAVNLTVVAPASDGFAQLYAGDAASPPPTSVLNWTAGKTRAATTMVALASDSSGTVALANHSTGAADFLIDVAGYWIPACTATITVTNPATTTGTVNAAFSQTFTSSGGTGTMTYTTASPLPAGLTLASDGTLSGTPTQPGTFPIVVTATDANGCAGSGPTYNLVIACQAITVTNPGVTTGTANVPFSQTFTQSGGVGTTTFSTASALPIGMTLAPNGVLSGTPTQAGGFDIVVTATDANGCAGSGVTYHLVINCQTITVTNPGVTAGTAGAAFSQTFTQSGAIGTATFTTASTLPAGLTLAANGVLSGTPTQTGTFPIVVKVTDANLCTGTGATYNLVISCQTILVTNPATTTGTAGTPFSQTFTQAGAIGGATFTTASTLPTGLTLSPAGVLSGTPTQTGSFPIVVTVTDANGCTGAGATYTLVVACPTMTVAPATLPQATTGVLYPSVTFTQTGGLGSVTFLETGTLPNGMSFSIDTLSGTPTETGSFPITVTATDANGCTGSRDYLLVVLCSGTSITLLPASLPAVNAGSPFPSTTFTASGGTGPYAFAEAGALPTGMTFTPGTATLDGTPTQTGTFPITVSATDTVGGCVGSQDYVVTVTCNGVTITVDPPTLSPATAGTPYGPVTFTASGGTPPYTLAETGALPAGMTYSTATNQLSGTPGQGGTFPIVVTATDAAGCVGATSYSFVVVCPTITVTNPANTSGTAGQAFSEQFTQSGGVGTTMFTTSSTLPSGLTLDASGLLHGTPTVNGTFPIVVKVTDGNGCSGTGGTYTLVIACQTITVTNPATTTGTEGNAFDQAFTATGILGTATWSTASTLPMGLTLSSSTGHLSGTPTQTGSFPIVVKVTDTNGCSGTGAPYTLLLTCPTITVSGAIPALSYNVGMTATTFTESGTSSMITWSATGLPTGLSINPATGQVTGTPTVTGTFHATITATDAGGCTGSKNVTVSVLPTAPAQAYTGVGNTQLYVTGVAGAPVTPAVASSTVLLSGAQPAAGVAVTAASCSVGGTITAFDSSGRFIFTPNVSATSATCTYTVSSNTGGTPTATSVTASLTFTLNNMVWYVDSASGASQDGRSNTPFTTMTGVGGAATNSGDFIYVAHGSGSTTGAYTMKTSQQLIGAGATLSVGGVLTVTGNAANTPTLSGTLTLASSVVVNGIDMSTGSSNAITGSGVSGVTVTVRNVTTTTGIAVSITGSGNGGTMTFTEVSAGTAASGPTSGIVLDNFAGAFSVLGDGTNGSNGSGGTIQKTTGDGISLGTVTGTGVSLSSMIVKNGSHAGIKGTSVNNFALLGTQVTGNGSSDAANDNGVRLIDASGAVTFTNDTVTGSFAHNVWLSATPSSTAAITSLTVTNGSYSSSSGGDGFLVSLSHTASIATGTFSGVTFAANASMALNLVTNDDSVIGNSVGSPPTGAVTITGSTFTNSGGLGVSFASGGGSGSSSMYVRFVSNTMTGTHSHAINVDAGANATGGTQRVLIDDNVIGNVGVTGSGSAIGEGIVVTQQGNVTQTVTITNNTIRQIPLGRGIDVEALGPVATGQNPTGYPTNVSITGNDVNPQDTTGSPLYAIYVAADDQNSPTLVHAAVHGNTVPSTSACDSSCTASTGMIWYEVVTAPSTGTLFNFGGNGTVSAEIANTNTGTSGKTDSPNTGLSLTATPVTTVP